MIISKNSQLGLQLLYDRSLLDEMDQHHANVINNIEVDITSDKDYGLTFNEDVIGLYSRICARQENEGSPAIDDRKYLIQPSVHYCSELIRISENFTCSIFHKVKDGGYSYLMGKSEFLRFDKYNGTINARYWNRERKICFQFGFHLVEDKYYFPRIMKSEFNRLTRLMVFIELGDIEVVLLEKGRNNGRAKKDGKITNGAEHTIYVVDSSWNKLIIRTEGFAVRGHFRLQACGEGRKERKLTWIEAFEKHGYVRRPRASVERSLVV